MSGSDKIAALEAELAQSAKAQEEARRRVDLLSAMIAIFRETAGSASEEEVARVCLKVAEELTGSRFGFLGEVNAEGSFDTTAVSDSGWAACRIPADEAAAMLKKMPHRGINRIGLKEGKAWIVNDPQNDPDRVGVPEWHPPIDSFLGVPMRYAGEIAGMIALAGKPGGYALQDLDDVEALSSVFVEALNRRRAEKKVRELSGELQRRVQQLEKANQELESFSYTVSHDLRAPVRHITGYVELLDKAELSALDERSKHYIEVICRAARTMGAMIDDILSYSRIGRAEMNQAAVDLGGVVREAVEELAEETQGREVVWEVAPLPVVTGDRAMLRQVMVNLIGNALKFSRCRPQARIEIGSRKEKGGETLVFVRDNGVGFDMKYHDKLFGLFQRLHSPEEYEGAGVGLAKVQRIVTRHGGSVWAEGEPDRGATFWFSLPEPEEV